jgi:hypothetical protein
MERLHFRCLSRVQRLFSPLRPSTTLIGESRGLSQMKTDTPERACCHQYSDGRRRVVTLRSASVMIQILVPFDSV